MDRSQYNDIRPRFQVKEEPAANVAMSLAGRELDVIPKLHGVPLQRIVRFRTIV
jgi:hypothetical protein